MMRLLIAAALVIPLGLDLYMPVPEDNPLTAERINLGRRLFSDRRLSRDQSLSCASCHDPARAFSAARPLSVGVFGRRGRRNVPALVNRGYGRAFFWDGRITSLEEQVLKPIQDPNEMDMKLPEASARVGIPVNDISRALASYVRSILSGNSPYDRFIIGNRKALSTEQQAGLQIFRGKGNCTACHVGPTFTDERLHNTGVAWRSIGFTSVAQRFSAALADLKVCATPGCETAVSGGFADPGAGRGDFKTPTLREVARTSPYMHDGSLASLEEVVKFYDEGGRPNPTIDPEIHPLHLTAEQKRALVAFLKSLSGQLREGR
jgi:cytochrome c peroxidase